jgi:hypothetical protein
VIGSANEAAISIRSLAFMIDTLARAIDAGDAKPVADLARHFRHVTELDLPVLARMARQEYDSRRRRAKYLDPALLGEPAWDILLDLFIKTIERKSVSVMSSALASHVPEATAIRKLEGLEKAGLICRQKSSSDRRVTYLKLTEDGFSQLNGYFQDRASREPAVLNLRAYSGA